MDWKAVHVLQRPGRIAAGALREVRDMTMQMTGKINFFLCNKG
jgi:hypothetical protein